MIPALADPFRARAALQTPDGGSHRTQDDGCRVFIGIHNYHTFIYTILAPEERDPTRIR